MGYRFQFITLAGFHALNAAMFELADGYAARGMTAYVELQTNEFDMEAKGYTATRHQREVGAGYFDDITTVIQGGSSSVTALTGSTERCISSSRMRCTSGTQQRLRQLRIFGGRSSSIYRSLRILPLSECGLTRTHSR